MSRSVIVTGCSRGIGAALVTEFNVDMTSAAVLVARNR